MTYEYVCTACGHGWEAEQRISAAPLTTCPSCQAASAKRLVSGGAGFILKGGGWYADLYGSVKPGSKVESSAEGGRPDQKEASGASGVERSAEGGRRDQKDAKTESTGDTKKPEPSSGSTGASSSGSAPAGGSSPSGGAGPTASGAKAGTPSAA